ncbi:MAG TPA: glycosyltransferase [Solirubrobacteraceae bacterium]|nr:glycosyltransferase [Solirubrobacteraceae bacterium]
MAQPHHVPVMPMDPRRFSSLLRADEYEDLEQLIDDGRRELHGRVVWNVNSTAQGGGVVELLRPLLGYSRGAGVDARWVVIEANPAFFEVTKRLHNRLHGFRGDRGELGADARAIYERTLAANAAALVPLINEGDVVILHDPQTAGLVGHVQRSGATVIWRCHVGRDHLNGPAHEAWDFLRPYILDAGAYVFSRRIFAWDGLPKDRIVIIPPSIDAFSPKNEEQSPSQSLAILSRAGLVPQARTGSPTFVRSDGTPGRVDRCATLTQERPLTPDDPVVMQLSRWDRLKDPVGVMKAFAGYVAPRSDAHLLLAGPATDSVSDDPEGAAVLATVRRAFAALAPEVRARVHLASLPMDDGEENAAIVNALQRHATIVVQKSLAEGFGLTVAEAMWKARPVVASRVGGIVEQIVDGESGVLIANPRDLEVTGEAILALLSDPRRARRLGQAAKERIREAFLAPRHLRRYFELIQRLVRDDEPVGPAPAAELVLPEAR